RSLQKLDTRGTQPSVPSPCLRDIPPSTPGAAMSLPAEIRSTVRALARTPTVAVAAVLCLTLGIGATAAVWSAVSTALLKPLPFRDQDRIVAVYRTSPNTG